MYRITITLQEPEFEALRAMAKAHTRPAKHQIVHLIRQAAIQEGLLAEETLMRAKIIALPSPNPPPPASRDREHGQWAALGRVLLGILARRQAQGQPETATEPERNAPDAR